VVSGEKTMMLKGEWLLARVLLIEHFYVGGELKSFMLNLLTQNVYSSLHNVRIEHLWRDVHKDSLEAFRQTFMYLEEVGLLDMENQVHCMCLYLVFRHRIQQSLDRTRDAWNHHKLRTEGNKTPIAIYKLSCETAITRGYWTGDPGDDVATALDPLYGFDGEAPMPPAAESLDGAEEGEEPSNTDEERATGISMNGDDELHEATEMLAGLDLNAEDGNWGIEVYCEAVIVLTARLEAQNQESQ
jgi:hypothetical protein